MASLLKVSRMLGGDKPAVALAAAAPATDVQMPITQVRLGGADAYDPLSHVSMMDKVRATDSILVGSATAPLVEYRDIENLDDLRSRFVWQGDHVFYEDFDVFYQIASSLSSREPTR